MKKYIVRDGDTLPAISQATGVRLSLLQAANPDLINPNHLVPGQVLSIPDLEKGSPRQHTPEQETPDVVSSPGYFGLVWPHVVQPGETWDSIADSYQIPTPELQRMNPGQTRRAIQPGDILYIPNVVTQPFAESAPHAPGNTGAVPSPYAAPMPYGGPSFPPAFPVAPYQTPVPGPYGVFPGGGQMLGPRAVGALWRRAFDAGKYGLYDYDESSSMESSWDDAYGWPGNGSHGQ